MSLRDTVVFSNIILFINPRHAGGNQSKNFIRDGAGPVSHVARRNFPAALLPDENGLAAHALHGKSGLIATLTRAEGYVAVPRGVEGIRAGDAVEVLLFL